MDEDVINGFGERLNKVEICSERQSVRVERAEKDIQTIFMGVEEIKKAVSGITWKLFAGIAVPTFLLIVQMLLNRG